MFKRLLLLSLVLISIQPAEATPSDFTFTGSGYGHGVGLSQIGARGYALAGESATAILKRYYSGIEVGNVVDTGTVRVNIAHQVTNIRLRTDDPGAFLRIESNGTALLEAPARTSLTFALHDGAIHLTTTQGKRTATYSSLDSVTVRWSGTRELEGPPSTISLFQQSGNTRYKYGEVHLVVVRAAKIGARIEVTNSLRLGDEYLYGVSEVPSLWPAEALAAQAIASRTYALYRLNTYRPQCDCNMYSSHTDQIFVGYSKIADAKSGKLWKAAVDSTAGIAMTSNGTVFPAYFFSSSAGVTESAFNAFGTATSFALSVPDTPSTDVKLNPRYVNWKVTVNQKLIASAFGLSEVQSLRIVSKNETGTIAKIEAQSAAGKKVVLRGETFRSRAKLPSAWFVIN